MELTTTEYQSKNVAKLILLYSLIFLLAFHAIYLTKPETKPYYNNKNTIEHLQKINIYNKSETIHNSDILDKKCYQPLDYVKYRIIHIIITRFFLKFYRQYGYPKNLYRKEYIPNGIRVMKKYLFPSLENQSCKNFIWVLMLGKEANISYVKSLLNLNNSFKSIVIYEKYLKNFIRNITRGFDVLITTRIDYDDEIYYDAVNDVRKAIYINKPMILYGYNRGVYYFETNNKYYDYYYGNKDGVWSVFISLIIVLNKVNDTYTVYDLGHHAFIIKKLIKEYKSYGMKILNYEPAIFDDGDPKFIYVRQKYSGTFNYTIGIPNKKKAHNFNLNKFYGKF